MGHQTLEPVVPQQLHHKPQSTRQQLPGMLRQLLLAVSAHHPLVYQAAVLHHQVQ